MKAIIRTKAGKDFSTMKVEEVTAPVIKRGELKVKMAYSRINPVDMDLMKGFPSLKYKTPQIGGIDGAGTVVEVSTDVSGYAVGDHVIFYRLFSDIGTWAEEIAIEALDCAKVPAHLAVSDIGACVLPLLTAYEGLMEFNAQPGETVLIHGAGGGVGFQAVKIAKKLGLRVIANASINDQEDLKKLGVEHLIDYKSEDFFEVLSENPPDYVFDVIGKETLKKSILLCPRAVVSTSFPDVNKMGKAGVKLPGIFRFLMKQMNRKFIRLARKKDVKLIGQVTGANGDHLQKALKMIDADAVFRNYSAKTMQEIETKGLSKKDIGKVIVF